MWQPTDQFQRPLRQLRLSVTDRCNLRCHYCMPEDEYNWLPKSHILSFEELERTARIFAKLGVEKIRLTGGEPLLRRDLDVLVEKLLRVEGIEEIALTTNATLLENQAEKLYRAGLGKLTISLDTLSAEDFHKLTRWGKLEDVFRGIHVARQIGFTNIKSNAVVIRGQNENQICELLTFGQKYGIEVRFIEYMDVAGATQWESEQVVSRGEILKSIEKHFGHVSESVKEKSSSPADRFQLQDGTTFGIISSTTEPFCASCDRARLTADGQLFTCLYAQSGHDLRDVLRTSPRDEDVLHFLGDIWAKRRDRTAEQRKEMKDRGAFLNAEKLKNNPHVEMHSKGG